MTRAPLLLAAAALLATPALASAHDATIVCDATDPTGYRVTPDFTHLDPVTTFGPAGATVRWRDGYVVRLPYPTWCVVPPPVVPPPPVEPPAPPNPTLPPPPDAKSEAPLLDLPVTPQPSSTPAPPVVTPGGPVEPQPKVRTCRELLAKPRAGRRTLIRLGCVEPKPRRVTCAYLKKHRAGKLSYVRAGYYFRCKAPVPPRKGQPFVPKVSG